jgi:hypothetical protein
VSNFYENENINMIVMKIYLVSKMNAFIGKNVTLVQNKEHKRFFVLNLGVDELIHLVET